MDNEYPFFVPPLAFHVSAVNPRCRREFGNMNICVFTRLSPWVLPTATRKKELALSIVGVQEQEGRSLSHADCQLCHRRDAREGAGRDELYIIVP